MSITTIIIRHVAVVITTCRRYVTARATQLGNKHALVTIIASFSGVGSFGAIVIDANAKHTVWAS